MKRKLLWCLALTSLVATTSCSQDETVDEPTPQRHAIAFTSFIDKQTRAGETQDPTDLDDTDNENFNSFQVWAYETPKDPNSTDAAPTYLPGGFILGNITIKKDATTNVWNYETPDLTAYWSVGSKYAFLGVGPSNFVTQTSETGGNIINVTPTVREDKSTMDGAVIAFENRVGTIDVVAALNQSFASSPWIANSSPKSVALKFGHILSRIHFAFTNTMADGSKLEIANVQILHSTRKGNATVSVDGDGNTIALWYKTEAETQDVSPEYAQLMFAGATKTRTGEDAKDVFENISSSGYFINSGKTALTKSLLIIPDNAAALRVQFTIRHKKGELIKEYTKEVPITAPADGWKSGYCYLLSAELTTDNITDNAWEPIVFTATVDSWNTGDHNGGSINMEGTTPAPDNPIIRKKRR